MNRRDFLLKGACAAVALPALSNPAFGSIRGGILAAPKHTFKLKYAPHFGMFQQSAGKDPMDQLKFMADVGFTAFEDNGMMGRAPEVQQRIGDTLAKLGMSMGVFVIDGGDNWKVSLAAGKPEFRDNFLKTCRAAVDVARRVNAKWMTVVPGYFERRLPIGVQTGHVVDALRAGADILAPHKLTMVLEALSDNPDLFLRTSDQSYAICRAVNSPACKILFDIYHMQRNEGHVIPNIDHVWNEIGYFQIGDVPGRKEPGTGELNYRNVFKHVYDRSKKAGVEFIMGMEHGNAFPGADGEQKLIDAYVAADSFMTS